MGAIADLWRSERGLLCLILIAAATVLAAIGKLPISDWKEMCLYVFGTYVVGKTVTGAVQVVKHNKDDHGRPTPPHNPPVTDVEASS